MRYDDFEGYARQQLHNHLPDDDEWIEFTPRGTDGEQVGTVVTFYLTPYAPGDGINRDRIDQLVYVCAGYDSEIRFSGDKEPGELAVDVRTNLNFPDAFDGDEWTDQDLHAVAGGNPAEIAEQVYGVETGVPKMGV